MNKLMSVVAASVCAVSISGVACAADEAAADKHAKPEAAEELKEESDAAALEVGYDFDFLSAYVWRNAIQTDEMVMQHSVWADWTFIDPFYIGGSFWQNFDLTDRRHGIYEKGLTENDYNVHVGATAWQSEDEKMSLGLELAHEWYDNLYVRNSYECPDTREIYLKATFNNELVNVYGQVAWMYEDFGCHKQGVHYELGFNKEVEVYESVTVGADWNVSFGTGNYLNFLYGNTVSGRDEDGEYEYNGSSAGFGGTTVKIYVNWQVTDWFSVGGLIAYTGVLNSSYRDSLGRIGDDYWDGGDFYQRDFVWGGLQAKLSF